MSHQTNSNTKMLKIYFKCGTVLEFKTFQNIDLTRFGMKIVKDPVKWVSSVAIQSLTKSNPDSDYTGSKLRNILESSYLDDDEIVGVTGNLKLPDGEWTAYGIPVQLEVDSIHFYKNGHKFAYWASTDSNTHYKIRNTLVDLTDPFVKFIA